MASLLHHLRHGCVENARRHYKDDGPEAVLGRGSKRDSANRSVNSYSLPLNTYFEDTARDPSPECHLQATKQQH